MALVTNIQRFSMHDGPGVRTTVFLKGCPLNCNWCHNPETKSIRQQVELQPLRCMGCGACESACPQGCHRIIEGEHQYHSDGCIGCLACTAVCLPCALVPVARDMSVDDIMVEVSKDIPFYGEQGGVTLSGGEPMLWPQTVVGVCSAAKDRGFTTAIETCGFFPEERLRILPGICDLLLWDIKDTDSQRHEVNTGVSPQIIWENLHHADELGLHTILRLIIIAGINDTEDHMKAVARLYKTLHHCKGVQLLPFHPYGNAKYTNVGMEGGTMGKEYIPAQEVIDGLKIRLEKQGIRVLCE